MKVSFELRREKRNANGLIPIQVLVRADGHRLRKNVGESVLEKYWNGSRVIPNLKKEEYNRHQEINDRLVEVEERIRQISLFFTLNKLSFSKEIFIQKFEGNKEIKVEIHDFFECFEEFIESGKLSKAYNTIKAQTTVKNFLQEFQKTKKIKIEFDTVTDSFFEKLSKFCFF